MLSFDIRAVESQAQPVHGTLAGDDPIWEPTDPRPLDAVTVDGRLSTAGGGRFWFSGRLSGSTVVACRRCLIDVTAPVSDELSVLFAEPGLDESDEDDVYPLAANARTIDLRSAVREAWLLAVPGFVTCRDGCRGLCPTCGADRNETACGCAERVVDERWAALRATRDVTE
ncbi:MAG TPA: DUF177 domain-containing protein [Gemmatimonadaceae bacterium]|jgi:uncharacterized protein|nr:DUF177 domain-containing protein [Gemmatimonadaceae bacterium]